VTDLKGKGESFGVPGMECNGMDVMDTYAVTQEAVRIAREERQPILVEAETYRLRGHSMADPEEYRTKEEVAEYRKQDPIATFGRRLVDEGVLEEGDLEKMDADAVAQVDEAVRHADDAPFPPPEALYDHIYVMGDQVQGWYSVDERSAGVHKGEDEREMAGELGARSDLYEETAEQMQKQDASADPDEDEGTDQAASTEDRGDAPHESANEPGANQAPSAG
jgi:2-oxoglutarate dehydrogenase complex dehydrogenase (E1) component-like enzyme